MTVTRRIRSPGRARNKPLKPLRAGMPGESGCTCGDYARVLCFISHARLRVRRAPGIPHALCFLGANGSCTPRAQSRRGNAEAHLELIRKQFMQCERAIPCVVPRARGKSRYLSRLRGRSTREARRVGETDYPLD